MTSRSPSILLNRRCFSRYLAYTSAVRESVDLLDLGLDVYMHMYVYIHRYVCMRAYLSLPPLPASLYLFPPSLCRLSMVRRRNATR